METTTIQMILSNTLKARHHRPQVRRQSRRQKRKRKSIQGGQLQKGRRRMKRKMRKQTKNWTKRKTMMYRKNPITVTQRKSRRKNTLKMLRKVHTNQGYRSQVYNLIKTHAGWLAQWCNQSMTVAVLEVC